MIKIMLMALLLQGNVMAKTEDDLRREAIMSFVDNFSQKHDIDIKPTSGHRDESHNHEQYGGVDLPVSQLPEELQDEFIKEMAGVGALDGNRVIDERDARSDKQWKRDAGLGKGIVHIDKRTHETPGTKAYHIKNNPEGVFDSAGTIRREEPVKTGENDYPVQGIAEPIYVNEEKPEVLEARAEEREEKKEEPPMSIEDLLSGKMMSEVPPEDMISNELSEEDQKRLEMERALAKIEEFKQAQAASQDQPVGVDPDSDQNIERQQSQLEAIDKIKAMQAAAPPEEVPQELSALDRLKAAQGERDDRQSEAMRLRGLQKIAQAGAVYADPSFKPDTSGADALMKQAGQAPQDLLDELKAKGMIQSQEAQEQKMSHQEMMNDPNSEAALKGAEIMQKYSDEKGLGIDFSGTNVNEQKRYYELYMKGAGLTDYQQLTTQIQKERIEETKKNRELREEKEDRTASQQQINTARGFMKDDPRMKKAVEQGMEFEAVDDLIEQARNGNQNALAALGTKLARAMGEVGVLTDTDVVRYVGGTSWGRQLKDYAARGYKGELSPETLNEMMNNMEMLRGKLRTDLNDVYDNAQKRMKAAYPDMDKEKISGIIGRPMIRESDDTVLMESPDGQQVRVKKDKVEKYKKKGAKVVQ